MMLIDEVLTAKDRIKAVEDGVRETPLKEAGAFSERTAGTLLLKCEHLHRAGSFKMRGATNKIPSFGEDERWRGIGPVPVWCRSLESITCLQGDMRWHTNTQKSSAARR